VLERVVVYGVTGSGKTSMAQQLSQRTALPWHSVDDLTWEPGWVEVPLEEQRRRIAAICAEEGWILDAAYGRWLDIVMARAQLIVGLDYSRLVSLQRLVRRTLARSIDHRAVCNGNRETLRNALSPNSIVVWHFRSFAKKRERIRSWAADPLSPLVVQLTTPRRTQRWLESLPAPIGGSAGIPGPADPHRQGPAD
jgi:adenylate kinase family enzyme